MNKAPMFPLCLILRGDKPPFSFRKAILNPLKPRVSGWGIVMMVHDHQEFQVPKMEES